MDNEVTMTSETNQRDVACRIIKQAGLGNRLRTARESMRISEKDVAARLHLNTKIITILENEEFENGPPETFLRGYIRSYARLLNIPDSEICAALTQVTPTIPTAQVNAQPTILKTRPAYNSHRYLRSMTYVVVAILAVLVSVWWTSHPKDITMSTKSVPVAATAIVTAPAPTTASTTSPAPEAVVTPPTAKDTVATNATTPPPQTTEPVAQTPTGPNIAVTQHTPPAAPVVAPNQTTPSPTTSAPQAATPTQDKPATADDMDMALSEPWLEQNDNNDSNQINNNSNQTNDNKNNNTN